jgi:hypothetical protein
MERNKEVLSIIRNNAIENLHDSDEIIFQGLFYDFEMVLGPVGAAKCLHLLAPRLFPLWDRAIAKQYKLRLGNSGTNSKLYWEFMLLTKKQCSELGGEESIGKNPLKAIDQYNYCKFTKKWI